MQGTAYARVTETRTPSGNWSTLHHDEETEDFTPHELSNFLRIRFPGERRRMTYTYED